MVESFCKKNPAVKSTAREYRVPFLFALLCGFAAHTFVFTNKLMNADEIDSLFGKGATITSGRWGLELVRFFYPNRSIPWLYGLVSVLLFALSACLIIHIFDIKGGLIRSLFAGIVTVFPSLTGTFCFMFTSSAYALSFLLAVLSVKCADRRGVHSFIISSLLLTFAVSIYQSYISAVAAFLVLLVFKSCMNGENSFRQLCLKILRYVGVLIAALGVYALITYFVLKLTGSSFNFYVEQNLADSDIITSLPGRIRMAYDFFVYYFSYREFALITNETSRILHIILLALCAIAVLITAVRLLREKKYVALLGVIGSICILPLAIDCLFLAFSKESMHSLALFGFVAVYVLAAMLMENAFSGAQLPKKLGRDAVYICLAFAIVSNIYFANAVYLKLHLQYENAYSFCSILLNRVQNTEGFDENCKLAIIGDQHNKMRYYPEIDIGYIQGPSYDLVNIYSREKFFNYYLGSSIPFASKQELDQLKGDERFISMQEYPYDGSVKKIDDYIVVKLG